MNISCRWSAVGFERKRIDYGETGLGKRVARALHKHGRSDKPFIALNMAAIPADLVESELFGHEQAHLPGLIKRDGRFLQADGGTLFLDEIGDMPLSVQTLIACVSRRPVLSSRCASGTG